VGGWAYPFGWFFPRTLDLHVSCADTPRMDTNQTDPQTFEAQAYELGCEHARNAASWIDPATHPPKVLLAMIEDGDPAVFDYLPHEPNLSGEYSGDLTPRTLAWQIMGDDAIVSDDRMDALADAYEAGVSDTFQPECERILREAL